jgi:anti-anti-sigma regulatory factor
VTAGGFPVVPLGDDGALVVFDGTIGALDTSDVATALEAATAAPVRRVVVDLTRAEIADPDALAALYDAARLLRARDGVLAVATPDGSTVHRVLRTSGLGAAFAVYGTRRAALDDLDLDDPAS